MGYKTGGRGIFKPVPLPSFMGWGNWPHAQPPTWRTAGLSFVRRLLLDQSVKVKPARYYKKVPAGIALGIIETIKLHQHGKVSPKIRGTKMGNSHR